MVGEAKGIFAWEICPSWEVVLSPTGANVREWILHWRRMYWK
jgi:hypothetical protein